MNVTPWPRCVRRFIVLVALGSLTTGCLQGPDAQPITAYGAAADRDFARALWQALDAAHLVGRGAIRSHRFPGALGHGESLERIDGMLRVHNRMSPAIVLNDFATSSNAAQTPHTIDVIYRRTGYDAARNDWFWARFDARGALQHGADGRALAGRIDGPQGCIGCHGAAPGADWVFAHDRYRP